jgi:hypothetical protein
VEDALGISDCESDVALSVVSAAKLPPSVEYPTDPAFSPAMKRLAHLAHDLANPLSRCVMPQLMPALTFNHVQDALEEQDEKFDLTPRNTPIAFRLTYNKLQYDPLPFIGEYDEQLINQLICACQTLAGAMAQQGTRELGLELTSFHTTRPSSIFHYNATDYAKHVLQGNSCLYTCLLKLKDMRTLACTILHLVHATLTPVQSQESMLKDIFIIVIDGVCCIPDQSTVPPSFSNFALHPTLSSPWKKLLHYALHLACFVSMVVSNLLTLSTTSLSFLSQTRTQFMNSCKTTLSMSSAVPASS